MEYKFKHTLIIAALALTGAACSSSDDEPSNDNPPTTPGGNEVEVADVNKVTSNGLIDLSTDKAVYLPGQSVTFTAENIPAGAKIRYRQGSKVISEQAASSTTWTWAPPSNDFTGYMVDLYTLEGNTETIHGTIAVDVSSDWTRFPRYGFVATFDASKLPEGVIESEMEYLKRCHINGVQFQDWHNKHHWPLGGTPGNLMDVYKDIGNRDVYTSVLKKYISVQHSYGMKSIFYNLCFGALDDAAADGVKEEWYVFKNPNRGDKDLHALPSSWKSSIYLLDPGNEQWQQYLAQRNQEVYESLDFDGYQIDQLGWRGDLYDYNGNKVNLPKGYGTFLTAMKTRHPDKRLVMNAVASYGALQIASSGHVDFCYNEVWGDESEFQDLHTIIKANDQYSSNTLKTVFAAYMNYDLADRTTGEMNTPGVLMTDAVMMALGGAHLELGDHMLSREYFPAAPLAMSDELKDAMIRYYDFMTGYQNLLRGTSTQAEYTPSLTSDKANINVWPPKKGNVAAYARKVDNMEVIHLLNFINIDDLSWRDLNGLRRTPRTVTDMTLTVNSSKKVSKVWVASPDQHGGAMQPLAFTQSGDKVKFIVPELKYWTMIVME